MRLQGDWAPVDTTVRNLDEEAYRQLRARAAMEGRSVDDTLNDAIRAYLARPLPRAKRSVRTWTAESGGPGNERLSEEFGALQVHHRAKASSLPRSPTFIVDP